MYIIVRHSDSIIMGSATRAVDERDLSKNGYVVYEIENDKFSYDMIGSKLESFDEVK